MVRAARTADSQAAISSSVSSAMRALAILSEDFDHIAVVGPVAVAHFAAGRQDDSMQATAMVFVRSVVPSLG